MIEVNIVDKLIFSKKFRKDIEIIDLSRVGNIAVPQYWRDVFNEKDFPAKKDKLIAHWKRVVGSELPRATPHKDRLRALRHICPKIFRHITQIYLEIR